MKLFGIVNVPEGAPAVNVHGFGGTVELRGLEPRRYRVRDYVHDRDLGEVTGPAGQLKADFTQSLLVEALPQQP